MPRPRPIPPSGLSESAKRFIEDLLDWVQSQQINNVVGGRIQENGKDGRTLIVDAKQQVTQQVESGCKSVWG